MCMSQWTLNHIEKEHLRRGLGRVLLRFKSVHGLFLVIMNYFFSLMLIDLNPQESNL